MGGVVLDLDSRVLTKIASGEGHVETFMQFWVRPDLKPHLVVGIKQMCLPDPPSRIRQRKRGARFPGSDRSS